MISKKKNLTKTCGQGNVRSGKCLSGEMPVRGNVLVEKCPVGEVSFGEVSGRGTAHSGKCPPGKFPSGKCQSGGVVLSGNCPHTHNIIYYV